MNPRASTGRKRELPLLAILLFYNSPALTQDFDQEMDRPRAAAEEQQEIDQTSQTAEELAAAEGAGGITYEQVLADPDNIELNYKYVKTQIEAGNMRVAAATLERILMVDPALPKIRLTYAIVLYRLDNLPEAQKELDALKDLPMPASLQAEIQAYLKKIRQRRRRTNASARLGLGYQYDSNRNAAPTTGQRLLGGTPVTLTDGQKIDDTGFLVLAQAGINRDLGFQAGHSLFANLSHYRAEQVKVDTLDFQAYSWDFGGTIKSSTYGDTTIKPLFNYVSLKQRTYLRTRGLDFGWERPLNDRWTVYSGLGFQFQEFVDSFNVPTADERTGYQTDLRLGSRLILNARMRLTLQYGHTDKDAHRRYNAYQRNSFSGTHAWLLGKGMFLLTSLTVNTDVYDLPDTVTHPTQIRRDSTVRFGTTYGVPLGLIAEPLKDILWTAHWDFFHSASNMINYEYKNHKLNMMFTYKFDY